MEETDKTKQYVRKKETKQIETENNTTRHNIT